MKRSLLFIFTLLTITLSAVAQPRISLIRRPIISDKSNGNVRFL